MSSAIKLLLKNLVLMIVSSKFTEIVARGENADLWSRPLAVTAVYV